MITLGVKGSATPIAKCLRSKCIELHLTNCIRKPFKRCQLGNSRILMRFSKNGMRARFLRDYRRIIKMAGYTVSMDASVKVTKGKIGGYLAHVARDVDKANGCEVNHSNTAIEPDKTNLNETYFLNDDGKFEHCTDSKQLRKSVMDRVAVAETNATRKMRKDAVFVRPIIFQLDPKYYKDMGCSEADETKIVDHFIEFAQAEFGKKNIVGYSYHRDETNPHISVLFTPVTDDGHLSQKAFFKNPNDLRGKHDRLRSHLADAGYDIEMKRQPARKHLKDADYKEFKQQEQEAEFDKEFYVDALKDLKVATDANNLREKELNEREEILNQYDDDLQVLTAQAIDFMNNGEKSLKSILRASEAYKNAIPPDELALKTLGAIKYKNGSTGLDLYKQQKDEQDQRLKEQENLALESAETLRNTGEPVRRRTLPAGMTSVEEMQQQESNHDKQF